MERMHWLILVTLLIFYLLNLVYKKVGIKNITYSRFFTPSTVFEGEEVTMVEEIANEQLLPIPWIRLESKMSEHLRFYRQEHNYINQERFHTSLFSLMPYKKITRRHRVLCLKRGYYWFDSVSMTFGDPLGLKKQHEKIEIDAEVIVYPTLISIKEIQLPSQSWQGDIIVRRWIIDDPFTISGSRPYTERDPLNSIHWKATAKTGALQVFKREFTADHQLMIYINFDHTEDVWMPIIDQERIEKAISYAASLSQYALSQGIAVGFGCNGFLREAKKATKLIDHWNSSVRILPRSNKGHLTFILETMAKVALGRTMNFHQFLEEDVAQRRSNTDILIMTPFMSDKIQEQVDRLRKNGNAVEILWLAKDKVQEGDHHGDVEKSIQNMGSGMY